MTIIETSANQFYSVRDCGNPEYAHVWYGTEVKRVKGEFVPKKNAHETLIRKAACRVVKN